MWLQEPSLFLIVSNVFTDTNDCSWCGFDGCIRTTATFDGIQWNASELCLYWREVTNKLIKTLNSNRFLQPELAWVLYVWRYRSSLRFTSISYLQRKPVGMRAFMILHHILKEYWSWNAGSPTMAIWLSHDGTCWCTGNVELWIDHGKTYFWICLDISFNQWNCFLVKKKKKELTMQKHNIYLQAFSRFVVIGHLSTIC